MHDVGILALTARMPERYYEVMQAGQRKRWPLWEAEREILGATHAEVGAYLLGLWGLPDPIVEALAFHHSPAQGMAQGFSPLLAVHVADALSPDANLEQCGFEQHRLDLEHIRRLGLEARLPDWKAACQLSEPEAVAR